MLGFGLHGLVSYTSTRYCAAPSVFDLVSSNNMALVLLCAMVRVKRRVGTVLLLPLKVAARLSGCVAIVEVARLKQSKRCKLEEKKQGLHTSDNVTLG